MLVLGHRRVVVMPMGRRLGELGELRAVIDRMGSVVPGREVQTEPERCDGGHQPPEEQRGGDESEQGAGHEGSVPEATLAVKVRFRSAG